MSTSKTRLRARLPKREERHKRLIHSVKVPKPRQSYFVNLRNRLQRERAQQGIGAMARQVMGRRRSALLRTKNWHGGKQYVGKHRLYHKKKA